MTCQMPPMKPTDKWVHNSTADASEYTDSTGGRINGIRSLRTEDIQYEAISGEVRRSD